MNTLDRSVLESIKVLDAELVPFMKAKAKAERNDKKAEREEREAFLKHARTLYTIGITPEFIKLRIAKIDRDDPIQLDLYKLMMNIVMGAYNTKTEAKFYLPAFYGKGVKEFKGDPIKAERFQDIGKNVSRYRNVFAGKLTTALIELGILEKKEKKKKDAFEVFKQQLQNTVNARENESLVFPKGIKSNEVDRALAMLQDLILEPNH